MNLDLTEDQQMIRESFANFLNEQSSMAKVRAAMPSGFDRDLWNGLAELGAFGLRVPEPFGGMGLGLLEAAALMEEVGRTLASGPIAESIVAARLMATIGTEASRDLLKQVLGGKRIVSIAFFDVATQPVQVIAAGAIADGVIARDGDHIVLFLRPDSHGAAEANLANQPIAELDLGGTGRQILASDSRAIEAFSQALEEWKLLMAAALSGLSREALRLAAAYACERSAFGQPIGTYQAISHPLADAIVEIDAGKYLTWKVIRDIADGLPDAGAAISLTAWWNADAASRAVAKALHTFGGYGLTTDYDIHLYNLRAKAWPLTLGDPARLLEEAGRRLYAKEKCTLPDVGAVSIDFDPGAEARSLAEEVDRFFNETLTPELRAKAHYSFDGHDSEVHRKLAQANLMFLSWPTGQGGRAASRYASSLVHHVWENQGWSSHAVATTSMVGAMIQRFGSDELKREVLTRIVAGEVICSLGYSEPSCGSDVFAARTRATRDGDHWRIDGQKMFTSGANIAEYALLITRTNPDVPKHKGLTMFIVPLSCPGVTIQPVHTFQDERTNITFYDGVEVKDSYRLGEVDGGVKIMASALELEHDAGFGSIHEKLVDAAEALCRSIVHQGRPLIENTAVQIRLAQATAHGLLSQVIANRSLWAAVKQLPQSAYGSMSKLFSSEKFLQDSSDLLDLTAPYSLLKRSGPAGFINQCYRHSQGTTIYGGTSEIHRSMIAERNLGLPRSRA